MRLSASVMQLGYLKGRLLWPPSFLSYGQFLIMIPKILHQLSLLIADESDPAKLLFLESLRFLALIVMAKKNTPPRE